MQVFLNRSTVMAKNSTQRVVTLSATEAELNTATSCAQNMLFVQRLKMAMELNVKLPVILQCDKKCIIDLSKIGVWAVGHILCTDKCICYVASTN